MTRTAFLLLAILATATLPRCGGESVAASDVGHDVAAEAGAPDVTEPGADAPLDGPLEADVPRAPLSIVAARPPATPPGQPFAWTLQAQGGVAPYSGWTVTLGDLPPGTTLDPVDGRWTGVATTPGVFLFVVSVRDAAGTEASQLIGVRIGDPDVDGPMLARAREYQKVYEARHLWHGMSYGNRRPDDPDGNLQLSTLGDATFVSGQCTQAMALWYAVERTPEAKAVIQQQLEGWRFFQELTGVPGLVGRSYMREDDPIEDSARAELDAPDTQWHRGTGDYEGWIWRGDTSRDQVSGAVLGVTTAYDAVDDPSLKQLAAAFLADTVDHLWDNDLQFVDPDGQPTTYGDLSGERLEHWPLPNGQAAVALLAWVKAAWHMTGEPRFAERYHELLVDRDYLGILRDHQWVYMGYQTKWFNTYISWQNFYHLMRLEEDPALREQLHVIFRDTLWLNPDDDTPNRRGIAEWNPNKTLWYLTSTGETDPASLYRALQMVVTFPDAPLRDRRVTNSQDPTLPKNPDQPTESLVPIPPASRVPDMVIWHRGPFTLDGGDDSGEERTGCDYLQPYWLARQAGLVSADW